MTSVKFHHSGLTVSDLKRSLAFYEGALGMTKLYEFRKTGGHLAKVTGLPGADVLMAQLSFEEGAHRLELFQYLHPDMIVGAPTHPNSLGLTHICFSVDDARGMHRRLLDQGVIFVSEPTVLEDGKNAGGLSLYMRDPDGVLIELLQVPAKAQK